MSTHPNQGSDEAAKLRAILIRLRTSAGNYCVADALRDIQALSPAPKQEADAGKTPGHSYAEWKQYQELEKLLDDCATLCRRLARGIGETHPLYKIAQDFLQENDLTGSPLRTAAPRQSPPQEGRENVREVLCQARDRLEHYRLRAPDELSADLATLRRIDDAIAALSARPAPVGKEDGK